jgi:hypothetical protein
VHGAKVSGTYNWCWSVLDFYEEPSIPFLVQFLEKNAGKKFRFGFDSSYDSE